MPAQKLDIDIALLTVDLGNFRIGDQETTRHAYKAMVEEEGDDLINLADDILTRGLSPAESFIVGPNPDEPKHFIVYEGNRRLTALRLMETPALAEGTKLYKRFQELSKKYSLKPIKKISCAVLEDKEKALEWIERKHLDLGGRGLGCVFKVQKAKWI